ncbi:amino acid deaminase/aldolase [Paenibacillus sp.]|jgi:D-serine deaminase-like pyridoxal phosphate-dependent protein|uniref:amino acid deaminase/aldolase n=1 Tax=Paenibacillus sp. TaxID=58172 RepID=UPI00282F7755|nr:amino acid deaminase/aldolase [Paenibacillus sp.]MDR0271252.1 amino acid deaminase/aldolase [Paenibacillus sp.]
MQRNYPYYKKVFEGVPKPFGFVDLDLLDENVGRIIERAGSKNIRIATKSVRSTALLKRILHRSPLFCGFMCFSSQEAIYLVKQGMDDIVMGYPIWEPSALSGLAELIRQGKSVTLMVDSIQHIEHIERIAERHGVRFPVCLDMDMSMDLPGLHFGVWRSPIRTTADAGPVVEKILSSRGVALDGVMGYEAQIAGVGDQYPGMAAKNMLVRKLKQHSVKQIAVKRAELVAMVEDMLGAPLRFVNGGGTGSLHTTTLEHAVTEVTVGSGFFSPGLFDNYRDFHYQPATGFAVEIVRRPGDYLYTCLGGGYVASGAAGKDKLPKPYLPVGAALMSLEGAGEVQTPVYYQGEESLDLGDPIFFRHAKAGELCERFNDLYAVSEGKIVEQISTYRGDGQCFL